MDQFKNFRVEFTRIGNDRFANQMVLYADLPQNPDLIRKDSWGDHYDGLSRIYFYMGEEEVKHWSNNDFFHQFTDGMHRMDVCEDECTFFDAISYTINTSRNKFGVAKVAYYAANIPVFFRKVLYRMGKRVWAAQKELQKSLPEHEQWKVGRVEFNFDDKYCQRITRLYGKGKGRVNLNFQNWKPEETKLAVEVALNDPKFKDALDRVICIAQNTTRGFHQQATVNISIDATDHSTGRVYSFYWSALTPRGARIMNGCIMDHGSKPDRPNSDWSIHT